MDSEQYQSYIPASKSLPEITLKAVILSIILVVILGAANAYLGLKVGLTVSASIPAAVISMAVLRWFRESNILENNIVQTAASAGEALAAGLIFTIPALIIIGYWSGFDYWQTVSIALIGGLLGVLFSVPIRRLLCHDPQLPFPEGVATANVLKAGSDASANISELAFGGLGGGLIALCQSGFNVISSGMQQWFIVGKSLMGWGLGFAPALFAAGYIIGVSVSCSIFIGIVVGWIIGVPVLTFFQGIPHASDTNAIAQLLWANNIRYIGIGAMLFGGVTSVVSLFKPMVNGIAATARSVKNIKKLEHSSVLRTERDLNIILVGWLVLILAIPALILLFYFSYHHAPHFPFHSHLVMVLVGIVVVLLLGFILSSVCGYLAGLVGSSLNPLSGLSLIALIITAVVILVLSLVHLSPDLAHEGRLIDAAFVIVVTGFVCTAAAITNDTIQDLKAGLLVGATPWKQQTMMFVGVFAAALAIPAILSVLFQAYGIGGVFPHPGMDPSQMLVAPQAGMMATVTTGIFEHQFKWTMIGIGIIIGAICLIIDIGLKKRGLRLPVLAVAIGIYLPIETTTPIVVGGITAYLVTRLIAKKTQNIAEDKARALRHVAKQKSLLLACGLVAGSAVMGVILAIPFAIKGSADALTLVSASWQPYATYLGFLTLLLMMYWVIWTVKRVFTQTK